MFLRLLALFVIVPAIELALLIQLFRTTGWQFSLGLILFTGVVGSFLAKVQGLRVWRAIQTDLASGKIPTDSVIHGLLILVAGTLLLTPGILTDVTGFILLLPLTRRIVGKRVKAWFSRKLKLGTPSVFTQPTPPLEPDEADEADDVLTVDAEVIDDE